MKKLIAFLLVVVTIFNITIIPAEATSKNDVKEQSLDEILQYYQEKISEESVISNVNSRVKQTTSNIFEERYEALQKAGYSCYQLNELNYDQLEEELETDFSEIGLDKSSSYLIVHQFTTF